MTDLHYQLIWWAEHGFWAFTVAFALWRGDRPVRLAALVFLIGQLVMYAVTKALDTGPDVWVWVDVACLLALVAVALRHPAAWLLWACAFQLATVATYVAAAADPSIERLALLTAANTWWMLELAALLWGAVQAHLTRRAAPA